MRSEEMGSELLIWQHFDRVVKRVEENTVSLVFGSTGCGKSTQIPQMLLKRSGKVMCTQPRRLAAVAIAKRVAAERGVRVGEEVGFVVGGQEKMSAETKLTFATAGWLLKSLLAVGESVLDGYGALVVDEVHERSMESDVLLSCVRRLLQRSAELRRTTRLVLMSATLEVERLQSYMRLGEGEHVDLIIVDTKERPTSHSTFKTVEEIYVDDARFSMAITEEEQRDNLRRAGGELKRQLVPLLSSSSDNTALTKYAHGEVLHDLITALVNGIATPESTTLVFLPTHRALERQYLNLEPYDLDVAVLHSSIDVEQCVETIAGETTTNAEGGRRRRRPVVILSTNVAESSVTIPDVVNVVDSCLTNQIVWNHHQRYSTARVVFASRSQCHQRKGRAGRLKDGVCWRLVPRAALHSSFMKYETPAIQLQALDNALLGLVSSSCRIISKQNDNPGTILTESLDPPEVEHVNLSESFLVHIGAITRKKAPRARENNTRYVSTRYGSILAEMPLSLDSARLVVALAAQGETRLAALAGAIHDATPKPIERVLNTSEPGLIPEFARRLARFSLNASELARQPSKSRPIEWIAAELVANIAAFEFYQAYYANPKRAATGGASSSEDAASAEFCVAHGLIPSAIYAAETQTAVLHGILHRRRPWFVAGPDKPYYTRTEKEHCCRFPENQPLPPTCIVGRSDPFDRYVLKPADVKRIKDACRHVFGRRPERSRLTESSTTNGGIPCRFFANGNCAKGSSCRFSHAVSRRICPYLQSGCRFGENCAFLHSNEASPATNTREHSEESDAVYEAVVRRLNDSNKFMPADETFPFAGFTATLVVGDDECAALTEAISSSYSRGDNMPLLVTCFRSSEKLEKKRPLLESMNIFVRDLSRSALDAMLKEIYPTLVVVLVKPDNNFKVIVESVRRHSSSALTMILAATPETFVKHHLYDLARVNFFYMKNSFNLFELRDAAGNRLVAYVFEKEKPPPFPAYHQITPPPQPPKCCICLEVLRQRSTTYLPNCVHMICSTCAAILASRSNGETLRCPMCRA